jgi:hypothetical protein
LTSKFPDTDAEKIALAAFTTAARLHAQFWQDESIKQHQWLRAVDWFLGENEAAFDASQTQARSAWAATKTAIAAGTSQVNWDPLLVKCMDSSFYKVSWPAFQQRLKRQKWTLAHSDFHPANMMWNGDHVVLLDFEVVGIGSGPQDLSQFLISHMAPEQRRGCEERLVREYYRVLTSSGVDAAQYPWDECWADYVSGGSERWVWLLGLLTGMCPANMVQYWHDQLLAFIQDHQITPASIGMPRV